MAEVSTNVYDILFPSPPALKDIVATSIALRLWCQEINTHRIKNTLDKLNLQAKIIPSNSMPGIPSMISSMIENYVERVGSSIQGWLEDHSYPNLFKSAIFNDFIDFVADFDGSIHYVRTAKRFVNCDKVNNCLRFRIACKYCFEDDILRIWFSVSSNDRVKLNKISFHQNPELSYWIFRFKNQLYKLPRSSSYGQSLEEEIFCRMHTDIGSRYSSWSLIEYFWNRFDGDTRLRVIAHPEVHMHRPYRYLIGKFNEVELEKFANTKGYKVIHDLMIDNPRYYIVRSCDESYFKDDFQNRVPFIIAIWSHIKQHMNGRAFFLLVRKIIRERCRASTSALICCELWNTAPEHLKANAIQQLLSENSLAPTDEYYSYAATNIDGSFLLTVLSDASAEDRSIFWDRNWRSLIDRMLAEDYDKLMRLCFSNDENEISEFKNNTLSAFANVRAKCVKLLNDLSLEELNKFLHFCYPDEQTRRGIQLNLLVEEFKVSIRNITLISPLLNDFINNAYDDANLAADFKTQLLNSPSVKEKFTALVVSYSRGSTFQREANFIDILAPSEQVARDLKNVFFIPLLQQKLIAGNHKSKIEENEFSNFISECASNEDEIVQLKASLSADEMVQNVIRNVMNKAGGANYNSLLVNFLEWYFISPQELDEFKARYVEDDVFVKLITKSG